MEPINTNTEFQETFDDHLEMIVQDFNEFRERMAESSSDGTIKLEELIDLFIDNGKENSCSIEHNTQNLLEDFNKSKNTLPPHQLQSAHIDSFNINTQIQESEMMVQQMTQNTSQNDGGSFLDTSETLNVNSLMGAGNMVTHIRYGDLHCHEAAYGIIGSVFGGSAATSLDSVIRCLRTELGVKGNCERTNSRTKVKRKYRDIVETEEEMLKTKRETPTTAHANREVNSLELNNDLIINKKSSKSENPLEITFMLHGHNSAKS